ncbi:hypothetical protein BCV72DRAFT_323872 [Rhizopus microsporus var. microsporus]|uniref:F-box domain-containing protein n=1 Tax=Rhizopus microsporus var. microsporus TaxID=86635 RepID=A0A1X0QMF3_RHIZD|nr:hypothetical protein BCV72DRAFT_323872 [Rhizopus microsporus var. microsporus]
MSGPLAFSVLDDFIFMLFVYAENWNDIMSLTLVCKQYQNVALKQKIDIPFEFTSDLDLTRCTIPSKIARVIKVKCVSAAQEAYFRNVSKCFVSYRLIIIDFIEVDSWKRTKKICRTILKTGKTLRVLNTKRPKKITAYLTNVEEKYQQQHVLYTENQGHPPLKRRHSEEDFIMLKVPRNTNLRRNFLLQHLLTLSSPTFENSVEPLFSRISQVTSYKEAYTHSMFFTCGVEEAMVHVKQFVNCIVQFDTFSLLVTSFDIFYHNHKYEDDCAQSLDRIFQAPTAKISRKTNTNKKFMEISVFVGHYELLVVGGYFNIHGSPFVRTSRLLNQYVKRKSHELWSLHCQYAYNKGFYPISAISFTNHYSQVHKCSNSQHFLSQVLRLISSTMVIKPAELDSLWALLLRLPSYKKMVETASTIPTNFVELSAHLNNLNDDSSFGSILHVLSAVQSKAPCFFLSLYSESKAKEIALGIMTGGLKRNITDQHDAIMENIKKNI